MSAGTRCRRSRRRSTRTRRVAFGLPRAVSGPPPKKSLGQHFLADDNILGVIARLAELDDGGCRARDRPGPGGSDPGARRRVAPTSTPSSSTDDSSRSSASLAERPNVSLHWGDALRLDLARFGLGADEARREPAVQRRDPDRRREPRPAPHDRQLVRDGAARGRRPLLRGAVDEGLRCGFGADPARDASRPGSTRSRARSSGRRRTSTPHSSPSGASRLPSGFGDIRRVVEGAFAHRRKTLANSLQLAGVSTRARGRVRPRRARARSRRACRGARAARVRRPDAEDRVRRVPAPAKINLALVVGPPGDDGKHEVATVLQRVDLGDRVAVSAGARLNVAGFADDTIVAAALEALAAAAGVEPAWSVRITKTIPVAAGLGGGSSDAASALRLANELLPITRSRATGSRRSRRRSAPTFRSSSGRGLSSEPATAPSSRPSTSHRTSGSCSCCPAAASRRPRRTSTAPSTRGTAQKVSPRAERHSWRRWPTSGGPATWHGFPRTISLHRRSPTG